jgi:hypothetical protein
LLRFRGLERGALNDSVPEASFPTGIGHTPDDRTWIAKTPLARGYTCRCFGGTVDTTRTRKRPPLLATLAQTLGRQLSEPVIAAVLGLLAGVGLLVFSRLSFRVMRPEAPEVGLALSMLMLLVRMALVVLLTLGFRAVAPAGFVPFALSMAGGFLVGYTVELLRYGKLLPARTALKGPAR